MSMPSNECWAMTFWSKIAGHSTAAKARLPGLPAKAVMGANPVGDQSPKGLVDSQRARAELCPAVWAST